MAIEPGPEIEHPSQETILQAITTALVPVPDAQSVLSGTARPARGLGPDVGSECVIDTAGRTLGHGVAAIRKLMMSRHEEKAYPVGKGNKPTVSEMRSRLAQMRRDLDN